MLAVVGWLANTIVAAYLLWCLWVWMTKRRSSIRASVRVGPFSFWRGRR